MAKGNPPALAITVNRADKKLTLAETTAGKTAILLEAPIVSGCDGSGTPSGRYTGGKWIKDKTNPTHGPKPWSKDPWGNPYGPYFLPLNSAKTGAYTTYGIHGTRGPLIGNFEKPPLPQDLLGFFVGEDDAKYLYCSHGCIRLSNQNVSKLYQITVDPKYLKSVISVTIL